MDAQKSTGASASGPRNIPSLDGLRALSIALVILTHSEALLQRSLPSVPTFFYAAWGKSGVNTFFIISGFLITYLLLKELNQTATISLKRFYFRRAFRIFPPFYLFLTVVAVIMAIGHFADRLHSLITAATYTWNYLGGNNRLLEHTWSLSLEEQFYLLWPVALLLLGIRKGRMAAVAIILLSPFSRILSYMYMPHHRAYIPAMLHSGLDTIMFGCLIALLWKSERFQQCIQPLLRGWIAGSAAVFVLIVQPLIVSRLGGAYALAVGLSLESVCLSVVFLYALSLPRSLFGRLLNTSLLRHIGLISYSLYLWQQIFTRGTDSRFFPWNLAAIWVCAELSYRLVERPAFRLRDRIEISLKMKPPAPGFQTATSVDVQPAVQYSQI